MPKFLKEDADNPVINALLEVEAFMEDKGVSVYKNLGGNSFIRVRVEDKTFEFQLTDRENQDPVNQFPRPFDNIGFELLEDNEPN